MYIKNSEFITSPSQLPETFGLIVLEANILGKPFVGYQTGAYSEIIQNGGNGFLVKNKEDLIKLIENFKKYRFDSSVLIKQKTIDKYNNLRYYEIFREIINRF